MLIYIKYFDCVFNDMNRKKNWLLLQKLLNYVWIGFWRSWNEFSERFTSICRSRAKNEIFWGVYIQRIFDYRLNIKLNLVLLASQRFEFVNSNLIGWKLMFNQVTTNCCDSHTFLAKNIKKEFEKLFSH